MEDEVELFLNKIGDEIGIDMSCVDIEQIDITDAFSSIKVQLLDNNAFEQEVIYYSNAMEYLTENDKELLTLSNAYGMNNIMASFVEDMKKELYLQ